SHERTDDQGRRRHPRGGLSERAAGVLAHERRDRARERPDAATTPAPPHDQGSARRERALDRERPRRAASAHTEHGHRTGHARRARRVDRTGALRSGRQGRASPSERRRRAAARTRLQEPRGRAAEAACHPDRARAPGTLIERSSTWAGTREYDSWYRRSEGGAQMTVTGSFTREAVPFRIQTADGRTAELEYSSPRPAALHDERQVLETLRWFEPGKPLRNYMLHETDFYDEVEQIWGRRWGAEGIGTLREVLVSRPTENEIRPEYAEEWQYYYSSASGNADLGRLQAQFDEYFEVLRDNGVRVNSIEPPVPAIGAYGWIKNLVTLAGGGLVMHGGAILHRYGLGSWQRGREVIWEKTLAALQVPIYLTIHGTGICEPGAGRWLDAKTFVFNESVVANEEGLRQLEFVLSNLGI